MLIKETPALPETGKGLFQPDSDSTNLGRFSAADGALGMKTDKIYHNGPEGNSKMGVGGKGV